MTPVIAGFTMLAIVMPIFGLLALLESIDSEWSDNPNRDR